MYHLLRTKQNEHKVSMYKFEHKVKYVTFKTFTVTTWAVSHGRISNILDSIL